VIGTLTTKPLAWQQHDDEQTAFRQCTARIRMKERRKVEEERKKYGHNVPVLLGDDKSPYSQKVSGNIECF
jgi:hypothetical protein